MKIVNTVGTAREPFDVSSGLAEIFFYLKVAKPFVALPPPLKHADSRWEVVPADRLDGDNPIPPFMSGFCAQCGAKIHFEGSTPSSGAQLRHTVACDGGIEMPSRADCNLYLAERKLFYRDKPAPKPDALQKLREDLRSTGA